jgi:hypothetical protein
VRGRRRSSGIRAAALALVALLCAGFVSGCATLQQDGAITQAGAEDAGGSQVQIWPSRPGGNESAPDIVSGFLEAARSGASNQGIAAAYLTAPMKKQWQAEQNTVIVLADYSEGIPQPVGASSGQDGSRDTDGAADPPVRVVTEQVQGSLLGRLDANGLYAAQSGSDNYDFKVESTKDGWRISQLPANFGVLMERSDFESFYAPYAVYYENPQQTALTEGMLVPAQVYLPNVDTEEQISEQTARLVVDGVPDRLASMMRAAVTGVTYQGIEVSGSGEATVTVKSGGKCAVAERCKPLADELAQTLTRISPKITSVAVKDSASGDVSSAATQEDRLISYGSAPESGSSNGNTNINFYAISLTGQLELLNTNGSGNPNVLKDTKEVFGSVTAGPRDTSGQQLALISKDGKSISVAQEQGGTWQLRTAYPSSGSTTGGTVGKAGWDTDNDLWFTVKLNGVTSVYRYGRDSLDEVTVPPLGGTVDEVLPAPDNDRVAVRFTSSDGTQSIIIAGVTQTDGSYALDFGGGQYAAIGWTSITDFDWYKEESLAVLGVQPSSQSLGLYQIYTDGSAVYDSLTSQPIQASPPGQADSFVWTDAEAGHPIASSPNQGKSTLYTLSVEGQDAQQMGTLTGTSPTY